MKVVVLAEDDIIDGVVRVAGEVVTVADDYTGNIRRVVATEIEKRNRTAVDERIKRMKEKNAKQDGNGDKGGNGNKNRS